MSFIDTFPYIKDEKLRKELQERYVEIKNYIDGQATTLPAGTDKQTLRYNGTTLEATSTLLVDATNGYVGVGVSVPGAPCDVVGTSGSGLAYRIRGRASDGLSILQFTNNAGTVENTRVSSSTANRLDFGATGTIFVNPNRTANTASAVWMDTTSFILQVGLLNASNTENLQLWANGTGSVDLLGGGTTTAKATPDRLEVERGVREKTYALATSGTVDLDPKNGSIQHHTLSGATTYTVGNFVDGDRITLQVVSGGTEPTWPTMDWIGGSSTSITGTGTHIIIIWKVGTTVFGSYQGAAS